MIKFLFLKICKVIHGKRERILYHKYQIKILWILTMLTLFSGLICIFLKILFVMISNGTQTFSFGKTLAFVTLQRITNTESFNYQNQV